MQTSLLLLFVWGLVSRVLGDATPLVLPTSTNAATNTSVPRQLKTMATLRCTKPSGAVSWQWFYQSRVNAPAYDCIAEHDSVGAWIMLNAYRSGGSKNIHWRYVKNAKDTDACLKDWTYYTKNGTTVIAKIDGYTTTLGDKHNKPWCAQNIYRKGGKEGLQWARCSDCTTA